MESTLDGLFADRAYVGHDRTDRGWVLAVDREICRPLLHRRVYRALRMNLFRTGLGHIIAGSGETGSAQLCPITVTV